MNSYGDNPYAQNYATGGGASGGGGGFMAASQGDSPSAKRAGTSTLRPVTIRQILNADQPHPDAEFTLDGVELGQLTFVAVVRNVARNATNVSYSMEDGTGQIEVRQWLDSSSDDSQKAAEIDQNMYVRVLGTIKSFQNRRSVSAGHMRLIEDFNEVMFHKLDAVYAHLYLTRGAGGGVISGAAGAGVKNEHKPSGMAGGYDMGAYSGNAGGGFGADQYKDLAPLQQKVMQIVSQEGPDSPDGVNVNLIARRIAGSTIDQIREAVSDLCNEGFLYSAADDDHVLTTG
ncbi:Replication factor A protein 2 [Thecaphora frezii]